jgi:16S rRNA (cytosine967-C5)-methyltransferase
LPGYDLGHFIVQDISSMHVGYLSEVKEGQLVIDVCAAPGGKSTHVAQLMNQTGRVLARDNQPDKLLRIEENARRLDLINIETQLFDALEIDPENENRADVVLVDAPCSGLGIIRRKPDIKYNKTPDGLNALVEVQSTILANASKYVKAGGILIYSTCTLNPNENQKLVKAFLKDNTDFCLVPICNGGDDEGMLTLYPNVHGTDGFFISKMKKIT